MVLKSLVQSDAFNLQLILTGDEGGGNGDCRIPPQSVPKDINPPPAATVPPTGQWLQALGYPIFKWYVRSTYLYLNCGPWSEGPMVDRQRLKEALKVSSGGRAGLCI